MAMHTLCRHDTVVSIIGVTIVIDDLNLICKSQQRCGMRRVAIVSSFYLVRMKSIVETGPPIL